MLDILTIVKKEDIPKSIKWLQAQIPNDSTESNWKDFWSYFNDTWMKRYDFETWNISAIIENEEEIRNRTNNALESFNRRFNERFPVAHPNLHRFIAVCKEISMEKVQLVTIEVNLTEF